jgi:hypothetical protein
MSASSATGGSTTTAAKKRNHACPASVPAPNMWMTPSSQNSAMKRCSMRQRATPMHARA